MASASPLDLGTLYITATERALQLEHQLGGWQAQADFPDTSFSNCTRCGAGVVVDQRPAVPELAVDGEAVSDECYPSNQRTMDRAVKKRTFHFERDGLNCAFCKKPLGSERVRGCCSEACLHEARVRQNPAYARQCVWERDQGRCAWCRRDCRKLSMELLNLQSDAPEAYWRLFWKLVDRGFPPHRLEQLSLWDMDHRIPVRRGGGASGLSNHQTLCIPCHQRKTRKQARTARHRDEQERLRAELWLRQHFPG